MTWEFWACWLLVGLLGVLHLVVRFAGVLSTERLLLALHQDLQEFMRRARGRGIL